LGGIVRMDVRVRHRVEIAAQAMRALTKEPQSAAR
jgi:hypothetical protein